MELRGDHKGKLLQIGATLFLRDGNPVLPEIVRHTAVKGKGRKKESTGSNISALRDVLRNPVQV